MINIISKAKDKLHIDSSILPESVQIVDRTLAD